MAKNNFPIAQAGMYTDAELITPADTDLAVIPQAIWVGGTGDLVLEMPSGEVTLTAVPAGVLIPIRPIQVKAATDATLIVALY